MKFGGIFSEDVIWSFTQAKGFESKVIASYSMLDLTNGDTMVMLSHVS